MFVSGYPKRLSLIISFRGENTGEKILPSKVINTPTTIVVIIVVLPLSEILALSVVLSLSNL
jgi:hypothetical protein